jgi:aryl-alcohol dehydrogenase-like predicted oxidoreductase
VTALGRRPFLALGAAGLLAGALRASARAAERRKMLTRRIPRSGEALPAIGLGTWQTFDVEDGPARAPLREVLRRFLEAGGRVIDSSPMYGRAEETTGDLLAELRPAAAPFLATKVWTRGREDGERGLAESFRRMRTSRMDLVQVHNLLDVETHLATLREWKAEGRVRYLGVTHWVPSAFDDLERLVRSAGLDFVQLPYSVATRDAEERLFPAAADAGVAVLVNRPFEEGALFRSVRGKSLPAWAKELGCKAWSEVFLKFILGHPAVTSVLPATSKPEHLAENVRAGFGTLPDEALRRRIAAELAP